jgi:hypothetical protein
MAIIKFPDFQNKSSLEDADYIVGYKADGSVEYRTTLSDIVEYLKYYFVESTPPAGSIILNGYSSQPEILDYAPSNVQLNNFRKNLYADPSSDLTSLTFNGNGCGGNLDISSCVNITTLACNSNAITNLNTSGCFSILSISCQENLLTSLDIPSSIESLLCNDNSLSSLDLSNASNIKTLHCNNNSLSSLDLSNCLVIESINCGVNVIKELNLYDRSSLTYLRTNHSALTSLDVRNCGMLGQLDCYNNSLSSLDLTGSTRITILAIQDNYIESLDIDPLYDLVELYCENNRLNTTFLLMNLGQSQPSLRYFRASNNGFDENAVNSMLISMDNYRPDPVVQTYNDVYRIDLTSNAAPTGDGLTAKNSLISKGWQVYTN